MRFRTGRGGKKIGSCGSEDRIQSGRILGAVFEGGAIRPMLLGEVVKI